MPFRNTKRVKKKNSGFISESLSAYKISLIEVQILQRLFNTVKALSTFEGEGCKNNFRNYKFSLEKVFNE